MPVDFSRLKTSLLRDLGDVNRRLHAVSSAMRALRAIGLPVSRQLTQHFRQLTAQQSKLVTGIAQANKQLLATTTIAGRLRAAFGSRGEFFAGLAAQFQQLAISSIVLGAVLTQTQSHFSPGNVKRLEFAYGDLAAVIGGILE